MIFFFIFQHAGQFVFTFPDTLYERANGTLTPTVTEGNAAGETEGGRKREGSYLDEARGLLFSFLISLNLLIPILKAATLQCWCLLCVAPSQIKPSCVSVPFKDHSVLRSSISFAFPPHISIVLICSQTLRVNLVTSDTSVTYSYMHALE